MPKNMKKYFHHRGKKIFYTDEGAGKPVVLVHGYLETGDSWKSFSERLSSFRVLIPDLPGHGDSDILSDNHSMELMAETINGLLNATAIEKACIVGHSMGGYVTLAFLELYPDRMSGYCLFHSHPLADAELTLKKRDREIELVRSGRKFLVYPDNIKNMFAPVNVEKFHSAIQEANSIASGISDAGIIAVLKGMKARPSRVHVMEACKVPGLWILGAMDSHIPYDTISEKIIMPDNCRIAVLEDSGHLGFVEQPDRAEAILTGFIKNL